ncbi:MAG: sodium-dependent transporter [Oligoflexia bacterium]|nr:sodium-dependent transporter [Oligoflexia bacterium]
MRRGRATFTSRFGFYMAAAGSAIGLGTFWRFPYIAGANGGGGFVFLYVFAVAIIGLSVLVAELMLGKVTRFNVVGALSYRSWVGKSKGWRFFGILGLAASFVILSYYTIISGWVIHFVVQAAAGKFTRSDMSSGIVIDQLMAKTILQILLVSVHLIVTMSIVGRGVQDGIEKSSRVFMPLLFLIVLFLLGHSMFLPGAREALRFMFYPDFSRLSTMGLIEAVGHALFSLSLGFGAMVAYGSYLRPEVHLPSEAVFVSVIDTILSLCAGMVIFPIVFTANVAPNAGPGLLFKTLPVIFGQFAMGYWVALAFFVCLYFAALSSSISLFEGLVAYFMDEKKLTRSGATILVSGISLVLAVFTVASETSVINVTIAGRTMLEVADQYLINWTLPVVALGVSLYTGFKVPDDIRRQEFIDEANPAAVKLYPTWVAMVRWFIPALIIFAMAIQVSWFIF